MSLKFTIPAGESVPKRGVQGEFIYIKEATGNISLTIETHDGNRSSYDLAKRDQMHFPAKIASVAIENKTASLNTVEVLIGYGQFIPNNEGQKVTLTGQDVTVEIEGKAGGQPVEVTGGLTDTQLRAAPVPVSTGGLTDTQLRAAPVPVSTGGLTDTQLRAAPVPVSTGGLTDTQLRAAPVPVSTGGLTDTQLRASPVPIKPVDSGAFAAPAQVTGSGGIAANASRRGVIIKAKTGNTGTIDTGASGYGIPLDSGESVTIETTAAITITCSNPADVWGYVEY